MDKTGHNALLSVARTLRARAALFADTSREAVRAPLNHVVGAAALGRFVPP